MQTDPTRDCVFKDLRFGINRQEVTIESQMREIEKTSKRFRLDAGLFGQMDEVNLDMIQGVCVDDSVGTSISLESG